MKTNENIQEAPARLATISTEGQSEFGLQTEPWKLKNFQVRLLGKLRNEFRFWNSRMSVPNLAAGYATAIRDVCYLIEEISHPDDLWHTPGLKEQELQMNHRIGEHIAVSRQTIGLLP